MDVEQACLDCPYLTYTQCGDEWEPSCDPPTGECPLDRPHDENKDNLC